ncbi:hypothetical protein STAS_24629 [Striga asiatica]|uniref:Uncharacterized protein n=1 Tax=Striga asiatica TaxID=4170 RepID=A0A5A7QSW2_STRAF|nr:hypothetical protein STAS_24629 [Striga asiatica]
MRDGVTGNQVLQILSFFPFPQFLCSLSSKPRIQILDLCSPLFASRRQTHTPVLDLSASVIAKVSDFFPTICSPCVGGVRRRFPPCRPLSGKDVCSRFVFQSPTLCRLVEFL